MGLDWIFFKLSFSERKSITSLKKRKGLKIEKKVENALINSMTFFLRTQLEKAKEDKSNVFRGNRVTSLDELSKAVHTRIMVRFFSLIQQVLPFSSAVVSVKLVFKFYYNLSPYLLLMAMPVLCQTCFIPSPPSPRLLLLI